MYSVSLGQKYVRAGVDGGGDRKLVVLTVVRFEYLNTDFNEEKYGGGGRI